MYAILHVKYILAGKREGKEMITLLKGGLVVSGQQVRRADVLLEDQRVSAVGADLSAEG